MRSHPHDPRHPLRVRHVMPAGWHGGWADVPTGWRGSGPMSRLLGTFGADLLHADESGLE